MKSTYLALLTALLSTSACAKRPEIGTCVVLTGDTFGGKVGRVVSSDERRTIVESGTKAYVVYGDSFEVIPKKYCEE